MRVRSRYGADLLLVRPDQYVTGAGGRLPGAGQLLARAAARPGAAGAAARLTLYRVRGQVRAHRPP